MTSFTISVVPPKLDAPEPPEPTIVPESSGLVLPPVKAGLRLVSASHGIRAVRSGRRSHATGSSGRAATPRAAAWPRPRRRTSGRGYPSHRSGRRRRSAHRSITATDPRDARSQPRQPGAVVLPRAAAPQSVPRPGSGRSPRQHGHARRSMTTAATGPSSRRVGSPRPRGRRHRRLRSTHVTETQHRHVILLAIRGGRLSGATFLVPKTKKAPDQS